MVQQTGAGSGSGASSQKSDQKQPAHPGRVPAILAIPYSAGRKVSAAIAGGAVFLLFLMLFFSDEFALHLFGLLGLATTVCYLFDPLVTTEIIFENDRIIKRRIFSGDMAIPVRKLVMTMDQFRIRLCHGAAVNIRETIAIRLFMLSKEERDSVVRVVRNNYELHLEKIKKGDGESEALEGEALGKGRKVSTLLLNEYSKAVGTYRLAAWFMGIFLAIAVIVIGVSDDFTGAAPSLPAFWGRLLFILLALGVYPLLRKIYSVDSVDGDSALLDEAARLPWSERFEGVAKAATISAVLIALVAFLGFLSMALFGSIIDLYIFLVAAALYYLDFYPRLSVWEQLGEGRKEQRDTAGARLPELIPARRRSMQVSLVVMGVLAVGSYGQGQNYLYKSKKDCLDDWGSEQNCQEPQAGSRYYRSGYYYGPRYGTTFRSGSNRSVGVASVSRGGFGSLGSFHGSHGG